MILNPSKPTAMQLSVGTCPVCGAIPDWFNNVPLMAYCYGTEDKPHNEARRIVPSPYQPYADSSEFKRTRWVVSKKPTF